MFESMGLFAPNFNSQRRFSGAFVSTSPTWGHNKRSVAFRIPLSSDADRRIEHRVAGADASPHLTLAAILAAMLHGISNDLSPSPPTDSGAPSEGNPDFPHGLLEALKRTANSVNLPQYLPRPFLQAYTHVKRGERNALLAPILPGELDFYA
jgi:glutamine synthetase